MVCAVPATSVMVAVPKVRPVRFGLRFVGRRAADDHSDAVGRFEGDDAGVAGGGDAGLRGLEVDRVGNGGTLCGCASAPAATTPISTPLMVGSPAAIAPTVAAPPVVEALPVTEVQPPRTAAMLASAMPDTSMVWPWSPPTWKACVVKLPSSELVPLNAVVLATRSISAINCETSFCRAARSSAELVALRTCTASSRMRCRLLPIWPSAPSGVRERNAVVCVARCLVQAADLRGHALGDREAGGIVTFALLMRRPFDIRCNEAHRAGCTHTRRTRNARSPISRHAT